MTIHGDFVQAILKWRGVVLHSLIASGWFVLSLAIQETGDSRILAAIENATAEVLRELCNSIPGYGNPHLSGRIPGHEGVKSTPKPVQKATGSSGNDAVLCVVGTGVSATRCATLSSIRAKLLGLSRGGMVLGMGDGLLRVSRCWHQCASGPGCQVRVEVCREGISEGCTRWSQSRTVLGRVGVC